MRASAFKAIAVVAILLSTALLLSRPAAVHEARAGASASALTVSATSTISVVQIGTATVSPGASIVMPVTAQGVPAGSPLAALAIEVRYDPSVLDATACTVDPSHVFSSGICNPNFDHDRIGLDAVRFDATSASGVSGNLLLANITFQALGSSGATSILGVVISVFADPVGNPIPVSNQDGALCLTPCVDSDGDGVPDAWDNCPYWYNPAQNLPAWSVPVGDLNCDGFPDTGVPVGGKASDSFLGTDPTRHCARTPTPNDEPPPDAWPFDFNNDQLAGLADVAKFSSVFGAHSPGPPYSVRFDLNGDGRITLPDIAQFSSVFGKRCSP